jgi:hypothetical protein
MNNKFFQNTWCSIGFFILIWICSTALMVAMTNMGQGWGDDFAAYILQAKSIVQVDTQGFIKANSFTILQSYATIGPIAYPWGYPLLLAPVYWAFGANIFALKLVAVFFYEAFIALLYWAYVRKNPSLWMWFYLGLFAFNPVMLMAGNEILSDLPFLFFSTLAIVLIDHLYRLNDGQFSAQEWYLGFLIGLSIAIASLMRTNGLLLLLALLAAQLFRFWQLPSQFKWTLKIPLLRTLMPYALFFILTYLAGKYFPEGGQSHLSELRDISLSQTWGTLKYNLGLLDDFFLPPWGFTLYCLSIPLFILGVFTKARQHLPLFLYALLTLILYSIWPFRQGIRFLYPLLPIYFIFVMWGIIKVADTIKKWPNWKWTTAVLHLGFFGINIHFFMTSYFLAIGNISLQGPILAGPFGVPAKEMYTFIKQGTQASDVIIFRKPRAMRLMTDRSSLALNDAKALRPGQYVVLDGEGESIKLHEALEVDALIGKKLFQNTQFEVYRIEKAPL